MADSKTPLACEIKTFLEQPVLEGYPAFLISCPCCKKDSLVLIGKDTIQDRILFCPVCQQKLIFGINELAAAINTGMIEMGKGYNEVNKEEILNKLISVIRNLNGYAYIYLAKLRSERIGHYIGNTFGFLTTLNYEDKLQKSAIFAFDRKGTNSPCNGKFKEFLGKYVSFQPWVEDLYEMCINTEDLNDISIDVTKDCFIEQTPHTFVKKPLKIEFSNSEQDFATNELRKLGVNPGSTFVCFLGRDSQYTTDIKRLSIPRNNNSRNMDIRTFLPTMRWFAAQGIYCIRVGNIVENPIHEENPFIIDCSLHDVNQILDFYIPGNCAMFIGVSSGMCEMPALRKIPSLIVNYLHYRNPIRNYQHNAYIIYKKFYSLNDEKYLSFKHVIDYHLCRTRPLDDYISKFSLRVEPNTSEEILDAAKEVWRRINGDFITSSDIGELDNRVQSTYRGILHKFFRENTQFDSYIKDHELGIPPASLPLSFALSNPWFLDENLTSEQVTNTN